MRIALLDSNIVPAATTRRVRAVPPGALRTAPLFNAPWPLNTHGTPATDAFAAPEAPRHSPPARAQLPHAARARSPATLQHRLARRVSIDEAPLRRPRRSTVPTCAARPGTRRAARAETPSRPNASSQASPRVTGRACQRSRMANRMSLRITDDWITSRVTPETARHRAMATKREGAWTVSWLPTDCSIGAKL